MSATNKPSLQKKFAKFCKDKRQALGLTRAELAEKVYGNKKYRTYIFEIEEGVRKSLNAETMNRILMGLGSDIEFKE